MAGDIRVICIEFDEAAIKLFILLSHEFEKAAKDINRQRNDNVFHQLQAKYADTLKYKLEMSAKVLIEKYQSSVKHDQLHFILSRQISYYTGKFVQKLNLG